jgi:hypothetical protein
MTITSSTKQYDCRRCIHLRTIKTLASKPLPSCREHRCDPEELRSGECKYFRPVKSGDRCEVRR